MKWNKGRSGLFDPQYQTFVGYIRKERTVKNQNLKRIRSSRCERIEGHAQPVFRFVEDLMSVM